MNKCGLFLIFKLSCLDSQKLLWYVENVKWARSTDGDKERTMSEMSCYLSKGWLHWIIFGFICLSQIKLHWFTNSVLDARVTRMRMMTMCMRKGAKESWTTASWWQRDFRIGGIGTSEIVLSGSWVVFQIYHTTMSRISLSEKAVREPNLHLRAALAHTQLCLGGSLQVNGLRTVVTRRGKHVKVNGGMSCTIDLNNWWH